MDQKAKGGKCTISIAGWSFLWQRVWSRDCQVLQSHDGCETFCLFFFCCLFAVKLQLQAEERGVVSIKGVSANRFLAMKEDGRLLALVSSTCLMSLCCCVLPLLCVGQFFFCRTYSAAWCGIYQEKWALHSFYQLLEIGIRRSWVFLPYLGAAKFNRNTEWRVWEGKKITWLGNYKNKWRIKCLPFYPQE